MRRVLAYLDAFVIIEVWEMCESVGGVRVEHGGRLSITCILLSENIEAGVNALDLVYGFHFVVKYLCSNVMYTRHPQDFCPTSTHPADVLNHPRSTDPKSCSEDQL